MLQLHNMAAAAQQHEHDSRKVTSKPCYSSRMWIPRLSQHSRGVAAQSGACKQLSPTVPVCLSHAREAPCGLPRH